MNKMFKLFFCFCTILFCSFLIIYNNKASALSKTKVYIIFNKTSLEKQEELIVDINISDYSNVNEIKLGIDSIDELVPKYMIDGFFSLNKNSIYTKELVNSYTSENGLRLHVCKEADSSTYQNYFATIRFTCAEKIENVEELFKDKITAYLFDNNNLLVDYEISYSEKLNASWNVLLTQLEVYSDVPNYISSFDVKNRNQNEYELVVEQNIDTSVLGTQVISVMVIDKLNYDYLIFYKTIEIVDNVMPSLSYPELLNLQDTELNNLSLEKYISVSDNYDIKATITFKYYNETKEVINTYEEFLKYLKSNKIGYISFFGSDSSKNKTEEVLLEVKINDTTPPSIVEKFDTDIIIDDTLTDSFDINNWFEIKDEYDLNPKIEFKIYDFKTKEEITDLGEYIKCGKTVEVKYYAIDEFLNKTEEKSFKIIVKDTTAPVISTIEEITLLDTEIESFFLNDLENIIDAKDNFDTDLTITKKYFCVNLEMTEYEFIEALTKGKNGYIKFIAYDSSGNKSNEVVQNITIKDTTSPLIEILDIKEGGKYLKLENIKYNITDNFDGEIETYIKLNGSEYDNTLISEVGTYLVEIYAKDKAGNETKKELSFVIIEDNIKGCSNDIDCYITNYTSVIVVTTVLLIGIIALVIVKAVLAKKKNRFLKNKDNIDEFKNDYN